MTKGRPPYQALREARTIARRQGDLCENTLGRGILYDFAIHLLLAIIYVRVKRTKFEAETIDEILEACARDIAKLRKIPITIGLLRELWVRSPNGTWRFFLVLDDRIVEIPAGAMPGNMDCRPIRENVPGPDRSNVLPAAPPRGRFFCPFMVSS
jgi:hypothetical protein